MTNKEARKVLQEVWRNERTDYESVEVKEAIDRAIKTLEEYPTDKEIQDDMRRTYLGGAK